MRRPYNGDAPVTRPFGVYDPAYSNYPGSLHPGADYGLFENAPLVAAISGTVTVYNRGNAATGRGNELVISNGQTQVKYCHMNRIDIANGSSVQVGQQVGLVGWTGYVLPKSPEGSHLHFEVLINGYYVDPEQQFNEGGDDMIEPTDTTNVRIINSEVKGWDFDKTHTGQYDGQEMGYWTGKPWTQLIDSAWAEGEAFRNRRSAAIYYYDVVRPQLEQALADAQNKPPREVIKTVTEIVEKPVPIEVIKEVPVYTHDAQLTKDVGSIKGMLINFIGYVKSKLGR